ncbi:ABC transporter ATP-binding protein [Streptomyces sp. NBC_00838]|uniref:ABC transporter ATP-binding protein n=1 Tax=Streptomyces sp. NBC_00838 TaxID=2903680 RepID=UPI0038672A8B|nr:ABC transporter ATP-binding protein [Streptomyces sp. NBC_00838]
MNPLLSVRGVHKTYTAARRSKVVALEDVDLDVGEGEIVALIGPSGCGKSTLLRMMAGLDTDFEGDLSWSVPPRPGKDIGFVFQEPALLPWRTVRRNVSLGLEAQRDTSEQGREQVATLLDLVGLTDFADSFPKELSGGMRQRTAIARALAYNPRILLMDEPFGALDAITRDRLHDDLLRIWETTHKTIVLVTHSVEEATYLADRVAVMSARPGRIKALHTVPLSRERNPETRQLPEFAKFAGMLRQELV